MTVAEIMEAVKGLKVLEEKKEEWKVFTEKVNAVVCGTSLA